MDLNPRTDPDGFHGDQGPPDPDTNYQFAVRAVELHGRSQPLEVSPAAPSELPVSTAAPLKDRQTDRHSCLAGLALRTQLTEVFLLPTAGLPAVGVSSAFHSVVFSALRKCEAVNSQRFYVQEVSRRFIFALSLGSLRSVFFYEHKTDYIPRLRRSLPSPIPFHFIKRWV